MISTVLLDNPDVEMMDLILDAVAKREKMPFETMVFADGTWKERVCYRYGTKEEALAGHEATVRQWSRDRRSPVKRDSISHGGGGTVTKA